MPDLRSLPKVDTLSRHPRLAGYPEKVRVSAARAAVESARASLLAGVEADPTDEAVTEAERLMASSLAAVINMSGVVLHTGLGRARLAPSVAERVGEVARSHTVVEYDLESGTRGDRQEHVRELLCELTGAEDALVVNNAAAAVFLTLSAFAFGREVILSRGQMVEIGGSFRMPEIVRQSGCQMVEVGCTNKTHLKDYRDAIGFQTAAILRCHTSNYRIVGFTAQPTLAELVELARALKVMIFDDQGTGCLVDTSRFGIARQPTITDSVSAGVDVAIGSGDKLLGGPQCGLILGSRGAIRDLQRHPLARTVRIDKLSLAALEATLQLYRQGRELEIPTLGALALPLDLVRARAERLAAARVGSVVEEGLTEVGGGSAPGTGIATYRVGLTAEDADNLAKELRMGSPHIVSRIENGRVWLDPRTLEDHEMEVVECRLRSLL